MIEWNATETVMEAIKQSIRPVTTVAQLRQVLTQDFPRDCTDLPISGGWGYARDSAIRFVHQQFPPSRADFVPLEYHISQKIYEELIIFRSKDHRFSGIKLNRNMQNLVDYEGRKYDLIEFTITCWADQHWALLKTEWEQNDFGMRFGFDVNAHNAKRNASQVRYAREFWFDISEVFGLTTPKVHT